MMQSPVVNSGGQDICVRFYYHAYGKDVGSLSVDVDLEDLYDDITPFSFSGDQGNKWLPANVDIPASFTGVYDYRVNRPIKMGDFLKLFCNIFCQNLRKLLMWRLMQTLSCIS